MIAEKTNVSLCLDETEAHAATLFARTLSQWHRDSNTGIPDHIDYTSLEVVARIHKIELTAEVFSCLQVMEMAVTKEAVERANKTKPRTKR